MKTFFDSIFICGSTTDDEAEYPMKLEYYKTIEMEENVRAKYGIEIVKIEIIEGNLNVENRRIDNITNNQEEIEKLLALLKNNKVTPFGIEELLDEIFIKK